MSDIKFGTDGWRAVIAEDYTIENLKRVTAATAEWLTGNHRKPSAVIGFDCRFGGKMFAGVTARVLGNYGVKVFMDEEFASTPMVSLAVKQLKASAGIVITASHNPPEYNGFKIKGYYGGPALPEMISEVERLIPLQYDEPLTELSELQDNGLLEYISMSDMYYEHAKKNFDLDSINKSGITVAFNAMFGASQKIFKRLVPGCISYNCSINPSFNGIAPEPIPANLKGFSRMIRDDENIDLGIANDGDGDRIGLLDENGNFIDSHHLILLLLQYLAGHRGEAGNVIRSFSCTSRISVFCRKHRLPEEITKIGFKYIAGGMITDKALIGAEESGGIALKGHIPERDGVWVGLTLLEYMSKTHQKLDELIEKVYEETGRFWVDRNDMRLEESQKIQIIEKCAAGEYKSFGNFSVEDVETTDGYKFLLGDGRWVLIRPSGTEPVLRIYAEGNNPGEVADILQSAQDTILTVHKH